MKAALPWVGDGTRAWAWLDGTPRHRIGLRVLRAALGIALLYKVATEWAVADYLWGPAGIAGPPQPATGILPHDWLPNLGRIIPVANLPHACLLLLALAAIALAVDRWVLPATLLALLTLSALGARLPAVTDGGDEITLIVLLYLLFTLGQAAPGQPGSIRVWFHNLAVLAIGLQTCLTYFISGLYKAQSDLWLQGVALYYISQVGVFSSAAMLSHFRHSLLVTASTYGVLFWELLFPVAMLSRLRVPWILLGLLFEVATGYYMGLVTFSIVMGGLLLFLLNDDDYRRARAWVGQFRGAAA